MWLTGGDVDEIADPSANPILDVAGDRDARRRRASLHRKDHDFGAIAKSREAHFRAPTRSAKSASSRRSPTSVVREDHGGSCSRRPTAALRQRRLRCADHGLGRLRFTDDPAATDAQPSVNLYANLNPGPGSGPSALHVRLGSRPVTYFRAKSAMNQSRPSLAIAVTVARRVLEQR